MTVVTDLDTDAFDRLLTRAGIAPSDADRAAALATARFLAGAIRRVKALLAEIGDDAPR